MKSLMTDPNQRTHKRIPGGQRDNKNAKKAPAWISYKLDSREDLDQFIRDMIKATWTGKLGTRQASTVNAAIKVLLEFRGWIPGQPQPEEPENPLKVDPRMVEAFKKLPQDEQIQIAKAIRRLDEIQEAATSESASSW